MLNNKLKTKKGVEVASFPPLPRVLLSYDKVQSSSTYCELVEIFIDGIKAIIHSVQFITTVDGQKQITSEKTRSSFINSIELRHIPSIMASFLSSISRTLLLIVCYAEGFHSDSKIRSSSDKSEPLSPTFHKDLHLPQNISLTSLQSIVLNCSSSLIYCIQSCLSICSSYSNQTVICLKRQYDADIRHAQQKQATSEEVDMFRSSTVSIPSKVQKPSRWKTAKTIQKEEEERQRQLKEKEKREIEYCRVSKVLLREALTVAFISNSAFELTISIGVRICESLAEIEKETEDIRQCCLNSMKKDGKSLDLIPGEESKGLTRLISDKTDASIPHNKSIPPHTVSTEVVSTLGGKILKSIDNNYPVYDWIESHSVHDFDPTQYCSLSLSQVICLSQIFSDLEMQSKEFDKERRYVMMEQHSRAARGGKKLKDKKSKLYASSSLPLSKLQTSSSSSSSSSSSPISKPKHSIGLSHAPITPSNLQRTPSKNRSSPLISKTMAPIKPLFHSTPLTLFNVLQAIKGSGYPSHNIYSLSTQVSYGNIPTFRTSDGDLFEENPIKLPSISSLGERLIETCFSLFFSEGDKTRRNQLERLKDCLHPWIHSFLNQDQSNPLMMEREKDGQKEDVDVDGVHKTTESEDEEREENIPSIFLVHPHKEVLSHLFSSLQSWSQRQISSHKLTHKPTLEELEERCSNNYKPDHLIRESQSSPRLPLHSEREIITREALSASDDDEEEEEEVKGKIEKKNVSVKLDSSEQDIATDKKEKDDDDESSSSSSIVTPHVESDTTSLHHTTDAVYPVSNSLVVYSKAKDITDIVSSIFHSSSSCCNDIPSLSFAAFLLNILNLIANNNLNKFIKQSFTGTDLRLYNFLVFIDTHTHPFLTISSESLLRDVFGDTSLHVNTKKECKVHGIKVVSPATSSRRIMLSHSPSSPMSVSSRVNMPMGSPSTCSSTISSSSSSYESPSYRQLSSRGSSDLLTRSRPTLSPSASRQSIPAPSFVLNPSAGSLVSSSILAAHGILFSTIIHSKNASTLNTLTSTFLPLLLRHPLFLAHSQTRIGTVLEVAEWNKDSASSRARVGSYNRQRLKMIGQIHDRIDTVPKEYACAKDIKREIEQRRINAASDMISSSGMVPVGSSSPADFHHQSIASASPSQRPSPHPSHPHTGQNNNFMFSPASSTSANAICHECVFNNLINPLLQSLSPLVLQIPTLLLSLALYVCHSEDVKTLPSETFDSLVIGVARNRVSDTRKEAEYVLPYSGPILCLFRVLLHPCWYEYVVPQLSDDQNPSLLDRLAPSPSLSPLVLQIPTLLLSLALYVCHSEDVKTLPSETFDSLVIGVARNRVSDTRKEAEYVLPYSGPILCLFRVLLHPCWYEYVVPQLSDDQNPSLLDRLAPSPLPFSFVDELCQMTLQYGIQRRKNLVHSLWKSKRNNIKHSQIESNNNLFENVFGIDSSSSSIPVIFDSAFQPPHVLDSLDERRGSDSIEDSLEKSLLSLIHDLSQHKITGTLPIQYSEEDLPNLSNIEPVSSSSTQPHLSSDTPQYSFLRIVVESCVNCLLLEISEDVQNLQHVTSIWMSTDQDKRPSIPLFTPTYIHSILLLISTIFVSSTKQLEMYTNLFTSDMLHDSLLRTSLMQAKQYVKDIPYRLLNIARRLSRCLFSLPSDLSNLVRCSSLNCIYACVCQMFSFEMEFAEENRTTQRSSADQATQMKQKHDLDSLCVSLSLGLVEEEIKVREKEVRDIRRRNMKKCSVKTSDSMGKKKSDVETRTSNHAGTDTISDEAEKEPKEERAYPISSSSSTSSEPEIIQEEEEEEEEDKELAADDDIRIISDAEDSVEDFEDDDEVVLESCPGLSDGFGMHSPFSRFDTPINDLIPHIPSLCSDLSILENSVTLDLMRRVGLGMFISSSNSQQSMASLCSPSQHMSSTQGSTAISAPELLFQPVYDIVQPCMTSSNTVTGENDWNIRQLPSSKVSVPTSIIQSGVFLLFNGHDSSSSVRRLSHSMYGPAISALLLHAPVFESLSEKRARKRAELDMTMSIIETSQVDKPAKSNNVDEHDHISEEEDQDTGSNRQYSDGTDQSDHSIAEHSMLSFTVQSILDVLLEVLTKIFKEDESEGERLCRRFVESGVDYACVRCVWDILLAPYSFLLDFEFDETQRVLTGFDDIEEGEEEEEEEEEEEDPVRYYTSDEEDLTSSKQRQTSHSSSLHLDESNQEDMINCLLSLSAFLSELTRHTTLSSNTMSLLLQASYSPSASSLPSKLLSYLTTHSNSSLSSLLFSCRPGKLSGLCWTPSIAQLFDPGFSTTSKKKDTHPRTSETSSSTPLGAPKFGTSSAQNDSLSQSLSLISTSSLSSHCSSLADLLHTLPSISLCISASISPSSAGLICAICSNCDGECIQDDVLF
ncbi:hypothetical protein ADUPG1_010450, partial [Aduncisulcus paluster]